MDVGSTKRLAQHDLQITELVSNRVIPPYLLDPSIPDQARGTSSLPDAILVTPCPANLNRPPTPPSHWALRSMNIGLHSCTLPMRAASLKHKKRCLQPNEFFASGLRRFFRLLQEMENVRTSTSTGSKVCLTFPDKFCELRGSQRTLFCTPGRCAKSPSKQTRDCKNKGTRHAFHLGALLGHTCYMQMYAPAKVMS
eukprot:61144-Pelagomonas_calceolata.AAC.1